jgi:hypothetical protein
MVTDDAAKKGKKKMPGQPDLVKHIVDLATQMGHNNKAIHGCESRLTNIEVDISAIKTMLERKVHRKFPAKLFVAVFTAIASIFGKAH